MDFFRNVIHPADSSYLSSLLWEQFPIEAFQNIAMLARWIELVDTLDRVAKYIVAFYDTMTRALDVERDVVAIKGQLALVQAKLYRLQLIIKEHAYVVKGYEV
ncbi:hypothetical protein ACFE04_018411 [Oxalis oulophora]